MLLAAACSAAPSSPAWTARPSGDVTDTPSTADLVVEVYKSPTCGCCHEWEAYLRSHGYTVRSIPTEDMTAIKASHGLPESTWSCHTALIGGYVVEGHVPVEAIRDLLDARPPIDAVALPGMPAGSPGMPGVKAAPFEILSIADGEVGVFGSY